MRRFGMALVLAVSLVALTASGALAAKPEKYSGSNSFTDQVVPVGCPFVVKVSGSVQWSGQDFFDKNGVNVLSVERDTEQDTFSAANGKTLHGAPYSFVSTFRYDSAGNMTSWVEVGFSERVILPNGQLFFNFGYFNVLASDGFAWAPDQGHAGDMAAFCAALS
jgi:hypothetical protein